MNFYKLYLKSFLYEQDCRHSTNGDFIDTRGEAASEEFEKMRLLGLDVNQAQEMAMSTLLVGL